MDLGGDRWKVKVICEVHNHELPRTLVGHPYAGRLSKHEKKFLGEMKIAWLKPKDILCGLKAHNEANASTMRTIYNAKANMRLHAMERSEMQQLRVLAETQH